ncbi:DUF1631 family protein [Curvibacter sp. APW13]|uniref:DUF1631 family protein n=1 Tax=Curvibacter sp. APW13 TaxID=3077236 RepID=UPI0028DF6C75|nr:DUF1631 family protein [Curvibacter sp. APW13]MDT8991864.1 DUF1631 family protein [Curvibacter sp. APW13]
MKANASTPGKDNTKFNAIVEDAVAGAPAIMAALIAACSRQLYDRELKARNVYERDAFIVSGKLLKSKDAEMRAAFGPALRMAITQPEKERKHAPQSLETLSLDQLELMDENQVQESVALARAQQTTLLVADANLTELNTLVCSALGLAAVRQEGNPLRPQSYLLALKAVLDQLAVPPAARQEWFGIMSAALGHELRSYYAMYADKLRAQGVVAAGYMVLPSGGVVPVQAKAVAPNSFNAPQAESELAAAQAMAAQAPQMGARVLPGARLQGQSGFVAPVEAQPPVVEGAGGTAHRPEALLNLDTLRRLLSGELDNLASAPLSRMESFAQRFAREFEAGNSEPAAPVSDFASTVPAAFEALSEMRQVDRVVQRLQQRQGEPTPEDASNSSIEGVRLAMRRNAKGMAQALSLEVVQLMVENLARDPRLLAPVQALVRSLEPALLRLALVDPRFFSDKQHPARELLLQVTQRSLAYSDPQAQGLTQFIDEVHAQVDPLSRMHIDDAEPFQRVLEKLQAAWTQALRKQEEAQSKVVAILQNAEARNLLAEKIAAKVEKHPDAGAVPAVVVDFLCGPWAQVVAHARITQGAGSKAASKYEALISALLWSVHPELTKNNVAKLTKLVPMLLATLRTGLDSIDYPSVKTSAFFETLMGLHQRAFKGAAKPSSATVQESVLTHAQAGVGRHASEESEPWIAPQEAQASNFVDLGEGGADTAELAPAAVPSGSLTEPMPIGPDALDNLALGAWIELYVEGQWTRTQLTWSSPHGTLFLFTNGFGATQSMTRRSRDRLAQAGQLRLVSSRAVVEGALNAVAQTAMRNSVDTGLQSDI